MHKQHLLVSALLVLALVAGTQEWFVENLKSTTYNDGAHIPTMPTDL